MKTHTIFSALLAVLAFGAGAERAQAQTADSGAFFVRLGNDTIAVERYVRTPLLLTGEAVLRTPQTRRYRLTVTFKEDGSVAWYEVYNYPVPGVPNSAPLMRSLTSIGADTARVQTWLAGQLLPVRKVAASGDMVPLQLPFYSTYETAIQRAGKKSSDTTTVSMLAASGPIPYLVTFGAGDTVSLYHPQAGTNYAVMNGDRMVGWSGQATTFKVVATRAPYEKVVIDDYAKRYAAADSAGRPIGALSPRDSVIDVDLGSGYVGVNYGRPSKRGRVVFGGLVPWGEVWRTGANAATTIHFSVPVTINGKEIPAGKYTLWTIPDPKQWTLIINKQTGQWGTVYDPAQDLVRIPVRSESMAVPVETFAIDIQAKANNEAVMTLTWDKTRVVVPIAAK
jgi:hypothetical protein